MNEQQPYGRPGIRDSYTIYHNEQGHRYYRGALRTSADHRVIWECDHVHWARDRYSNGARACATEEHWRRSRADRASSTAAEGG